MLKKVLCIAAALCSFTGLAHGALTYKQTPALFLGGGNIYADQRIASNGAGLSVAAWSAPAVQDPLNSSYYANGLFIQRYDARGNPRGGVVRIDPTHRPCEGCSLAGLAQPRVAIDPLGRYVVTWLDSYTIWARLYDEQGKLTKETQLLQASEISSTPGSEVGMDAHGNLVVVYGRGVYVYPNKTQYDLFARRFNASGERVGGEITVSTDVSSDTSPSLAVNGDGAFAIAWQRARTTGCVDGQYSKPGQCDDILLRRFDSQGAPLGAEAKVADGNNNLDQTPSIAMDNQGDFVVAWDRYRDQCQNLLQCDDILAQRYSAAGAELGAAIAVIANNHKDDRSPQVAMNGNGKFVVAWHRGSILSGNFIVSPADALFRAYDANGLSLGGTVSYRVASGLSTSQFDNTYPRVGISDTGRLNVAWGTMPPSWYSQVVLVFRQMIPSAW